MFLKCFKVQPLLYNTNKEIEVIYEDEYCLVLNKPNNLLVHHSYFSRNVEEVSLVELLKLAGYVNPVPVHRLDRKTSGIILFSKSNEYVKSFQVLFEEGGIDKKYVALLRGFVLGGGVIDSPVKNERGNYKEALTYYRVLKTKELDIPVAPYSSSRYSFVIMSPKTGRMHQLRIHANKISHPIIGDHKYGNRHHNKMFEDTLNMPNLFLHAYKLNFVHPYLNIRLILKAGLPSFWSDFESL